MKAISIKEFGGPDVLALRDLERPQAKPGEAIVHLSYCGINYIDLQIRDGSYTHSHTYQTRLPMVIGQEGSGIVVDVGENVTAFAPGDRVAYCWNDGSYAEYAAIPAFRLVKVPEKVSLRTAAALMVQGLTAQYLAYSTASLKPGDTCLIHAAAGGVGQTLVQLSKHLGASVIASVGTANKSRIAKDCGADHTILYRETDFREEVMKIASSDFVRTTDRREIKTHDI